jgi:hypothetical protein
MMMSLKQSKLSSFTQILYFKSSKTTNLPLEAAAAMVCGAQRNFASAASKMSVSDRLRMMVEKNEELASKVRHSKQNLGITQKKAGGVAHPLDE